MNWTWVSKVRESVASALRQAQGERADIELMEDYPFVLSLSKHERLCFSQLLKLFLFLIAVALFVPRIAAIVVATHLPESAVILGQEFDSTHPFRAFPGVEFRNNQT